jgi:hypothetical protein
VSTVEETLAYEAEKRPRVGLAAILAGLLTFGANFAEAGVQRSLAKESDGVVSLPEALAAAAAGQDPADSSFALRQFEALPDKAIPLLGASLLQVAAVVLTVLVLLFFDRATRARAPATGRPARIAAVTGGVMFTVGHLVTQIALIVNASNYDAPNPTVAGASEAIARTSTVYVGQLFELFGVFALGLAFVLVSLNAMRAGLLTRLWGILGLVAGALPILQLDQPQLLRSVWLVFAGLIILGRLPGGLLPAWQTGRAEPWPTQQQLREQRAAAAGGGAVATEPAVPAATSGDAGYHPGKARKKRKRRK